MAYQTDLARVASYLARSRTVVGADVIEALGLPAPGVVQRNGLSEIETSLFNQPNLTYAPDSLGLYDALATIERDEPAKLRAALAARVEHLTFLFESAFGIRLKHSEAEAALTEVQWLKKLYDRKAPGVVPNLETAVHLYLKGGPLLLVDAPLVSNEAFGQALGYARSLGDKYAVSVDAAINIAMQRRRQ